MRRFSFSRSAMLAGAFLALSSFAQSTRADLIVNGGFEVPPVDAGIIIVPGASGLITGWTTLGTNVLLIKDAHSETTNGITFNALGNTGQALDITGAGNTGPTDGVEQSVTTIVGQDYLLSFWVGKAFSNNGTSIYLGDASIGLQLNDGASTTYTNSSTTSGGVNWKEMTVAFTATATTTKLTFKNATALGTNYAGLDGVTLNAVPEPGPLVLCATGLPLFLGISWFRNRRSSR